MRRGAIFWGFILVLVGLILMLDNLGIIPNVDIWSLIWPLFLILLGIWFIVGTASRRSVQEERVNIPLENATRARIIVNHGAGRLRIYPDRTPGDLIVGDFSGGLEHRTRHEGEHLEVRLRVPSQMFPFFWFPGGSLDWNFSINPDISVDLELEAGANNAILNLSELQVNNLRLKSGASSVDLTLPSSAGYTKAQVEAGAASVRIHFPEGVAGRIRARGGLSSVSVDRSRFPKSGDVYQSQEYETSENKVEMSIEMGVGSVTVS